MNNKNTNNIQMYKQQKKEEEEKNAPGSGQIYTQARI